MRLATVVLCLLVATTINAQFAGIIGAVKGITALSGAIAKLVGTVLPSGLLLPFAAVGPLKFSLPMLFALKGLGFLKFKLMLFKIPLLAPVGAATAKFALLKAKYSLGKTAVVAAGKGAFGIMQLPVKLTAMKMGAIAGANAGAKAGLARYKMHEKTSVLSPIALPTATDLFSRSKGLLSKIPMKAVTVSFKSGPVVTSHVAEPEPAPEPEPEEPEVPAYGYQPTTIPRPAPVYIPDPQPEPAPEPEPEEPEVPAYGYKPTTIPRPAPVYIPDPQPEPAPEPEPEEAEVPAYGYKPTTTPRPVPAYIPDTQPEPFYEPEPTEPSYSRRRRRREAAAAAADDDEEEDEDAIPAPALREIFQYILSSDDDRCVQRLVCELAVDPELAGEEFDDVTSFIEKLDESDPTAPWMAYKEASVVGKGAASSEPCYKHFVQCEHPTEALIETAKERLSGANL